MLERLTWRESACPALLRSLTFVGAAVAILLSYRTLDLPNEGWAVISVALVMQIQARASFGRQRHAAGQRIAARARLHHTAGRRLGPPHLRHKLSL
jgi:hypothetical protein